MSDEDIIGTIGLGVQRYPVDALLQVLSDDDVVFALSFRMP